MNLINHCQYLGSRGGGSVPNQTSAVSHCVTQPVPCFASPFLLYSSSRIGVDQGLLLTLTSIIASPHARITTSLCTQLPSSGAAMRAVPDTHHTDSLRQPPLFLEAEASGVGVGHTNTHGSPHMPGALETGDRSQMLPSGDLSRGIESRYSWGQVCILKAINVGPLILPHLQRKGHA